MSDRKKSVYDKLEKPSTIITVDEKVIIRTTLQALTELILDMKIEKEENDDLQKKLISTKTDLLAKINRISNG